MKIRIPFILLAVFLSACANTPMTNETANVRFAKKAINEKCLANIEYQLIIVKNVSVDIKHKSAKASVAYSKANPAGVLMLVLGDNRTEELKNIRQCASPYMGTILDASFQP